MGRPGRSPRRRRSSLRWRVTAAATAILTVSLVVAALTAAGLLRRSLEQDQEALLADRVSEVELLIRSGDLPAVLEPGGRDVGQVQVVDTGGRVVAATPGLASTARLAVIPAPPVGGQSSDVVDGSVIDRDAGERYKVVARTVWAPSSPVTVYAVTSLSAAQRAERFLRNGLLIGLPLLVLLAGTVTYWVVGRALAPVDHMRAEVDAIEGSDLSGRVQATESDDEISRLGTTLNRMLDRLDEAAARQRLFGAAASHELRSPLSAIRTELEVGLAYPQSADWPQIASDSLVEVERLEQLARDLRVLTRVQPTPGAGVPVAVGPLVESEVSRRVPPAGVAYAVSFGPGVAAGAGSGGAVVRAEPDGLVGVVRNLLDNAERHASSSIRVAVRVDDGWVVLEVANDGPAVPEPERERIFEPFRRLDDARSLDAGGSGLGLAIARSVVVGAGGSLHLAEVTGAGACFVARLPLAPASEAPGAAPTPATR